MIRSTYHVGDSYLRRDGGAFPGHGIGRFVALALGGAVAGAGGADNTDGSRAVPARGKGSMLRGHRGAG